MNRLFLMLLCATLGCDRAPEQPNMAPLKEPASKTAQNTPSPPTQEERKKPAPLKPSPQTPPTPPARTKLAWSKGVAALPMTHPCHNHAKIKNVDLDDDTQPKSAAIQTLGASRAVCKKQKDSTSCVFGPRLSKSVSWSTPGGDFILSTCDMRGHNFQRTGTKNCLQHQTVCKAPHNHPVSFDYSPEFNSGGPNDSAYSAMTLMRRDNARTSWKTLEEDIILSWGDGECCPSFAYAHTAIVDVRATKQNVDTTYLQMAPCATSIGIKQLTALCKPYDNDKDHVFAFALFVRRGAHARRAHAIFNTRGQKLAEREIIYLGNPSSAIKATLDATYTKTKTKLFTRAQALARAKKIVFPQ